MTEVKFLQKLNEERIKDILLMAIGIQFVSISTAPSGDTLLPLFVAGVLITGVVVLKEAGRRVAEFRISLRT